MSSICVSESFARCPASTDILPRLSGIEMRAGLGGQKRMRPTIRIHLAGTYLHDRFRSRGVLPRDMTAIFLHSASHSVLHAPAPVGLIDSAVCCLDVLVASPGASE